MNHTPRRVQIHHSAHEICTCISSSSSSYDHVTDTETTSGIVQETSAPNAHSPCPTHPHTNTHTHLYTNERPFSYGMEYIPSHPVYNKIHSKERIIVGMS